MLLINVSSYANNYNKTALSASKDNTAYFDVGGVLTSVEATCSNNGSITATGSNGFGILKFYIFTITNGPTANGQTYPTTDAFDSSSFTFNDLYPGNYEITIEDANNSSNPPFIGTIEVEDQTEILNFSLSPTNPTCTSTSTGAINVNVATGIGPYQYQIYSGPSGTTTGLIDEASKAYTFNNLPAGNYSVRVYDACGDFQTRSYLLTDPTLSTLNLTTSGSPTRELISCTEAIYKVGGTGGTGFGTYMFEVVGGAPSGYASTNTTGQFTLPIDQAPYTFQVTDACGQTATYTHSNPSSYINWSSLERTCSDWSLQIRPNWMLGPYVYTLTSTPAGYTGATSNSTGTFNNIPYGSYSYSVTDACGLTRSSSTTKTQEPIEINEALTIPSVDFCEVGTGRVQVRYNSGSNGAVGPVSFELTTVPSGFTGNPGPQNGPTFSELIPGNYEVTALDSCGNSDTYAFEVTDVLSVDFSTNPTLNCVNSNSIDVSVNSNNSYYSSGTRYFRLRNADTNSIVQTGTASSNTYTFNNLVAGNYYVQYYKTTTCIFESETVSIAAYQQPTITPLSSYNCGTGLVTVSGVVSGGTGPYSFSLINNANNLVLATNTDGYFTNQSALLSYSVRIEDSCGNTTSSQVSEVATGLGVAFQNESCGEIGSEFPIYLLNYRGMAYTWTFPNGSTYVGHDPRAAIGVLDINDFGTYSVDVATVDGCRTQTLTTVFERCPLPPISIDFDGVDDYIEGTPFITNWENGTIMSWVKIKHDNDGNLPRLYSVAGQEVMHLYVTNGRTPAFKVLTQDQVTVSDNYPNNSISVQPNPLLGIKLENDIWYHLAGVFNSQDETVKLYLNGELVGTNSSPLLNSELLTQFYNGSAHIYSTRGFTIGRYPTNTSAAGFGHFRGDIDEVRVFDAALTDQQIQQMVYQEIENNAGIIKGTIIPKDVQDFSSNEKVSWNNLRAYFPMTDIISNITTDYSSYGNDITMYNITTIQDQTAPMPYVTVNDGDWTNESTWLHGDVWDIDDVATNKDWSIIEVKHDINASHEVKTIGLIIDNDKTLTINADNQVENSWYLELNGTLDLLNDSQLIQTEYSDLVTSAEGNVLRRQEGTINPYWYNYWGSPVGAPMATALIDNNTANNNPNNSTFSLDMLKDGTGTNMTFTSGYTGTRSISSYWLNTFKNGITYWNWKQFSTSTALEPGVGYSQKGTGASGTEQQYIFDGKPNNGTILVNVDDLGGVGSIQNISKTAYLLANPYPSALDIHKFIDDNEGVTKGYIELWQQWSGSTHILKDYNGGYAQVNKLGTIRASQFVGLEGNDTGGSEGVKMPTRYIPIGQGFMAEIENDGILPFDGTVEFNNSQRVFVKEADYSATSPYDTGSLFSKSDSKKSKTNSTTSSESTIDADSDEGVMQKIRLEFVCSKGPYIKRELLLGFSDYTTDEYDYGYDARSTKETINDLNLDFNGQNMTIQAYGPIKKDKVIALNFKSSGDNAFEIKISETENIDEAETIYIRDNLTGAYFDLSAFKAYMFTSEQGIFNERFQIVFQNESEALSIEDSTFSENKIFYQNSTNTLFVKKINSAVSKLSLVNMRGQVVFEMADLAIDTLENGIQFNSISTGAYVVYMRTNSNEMLVKKIIIK
ncbi:LamG-like jellyroll fold domain-containing protein [Algibacter sp. AS12]|uniref:LamG-like jellyroll fold domain-containing protein n=1 Tax=Algibacter sp. AS12 TaxID=3135773 RepID=UPI00398B8F9A